MSEFSFSLDMTLAVDWYVKPKPAKDMKTDNIYYEWQGKGKTSCFWLSVCASVQLFHLLRQCKIVQQQQ